MKIAIVVGHTEKDKGAMGINPLNCQEYDYNKEIAQIMYRIAKNSNIDARVFYRDGHGLKGCYDQVNAWCGNENSVCVELHFNASNGKAKGTETLWDKEPTDNVEYAREVHKAVCQVFSRTGKEDRGLKLITEGERGHRNLALCKVTSCLIEPFFGDNYTDATLGNGFKFSYAQAIVMASINYMQYREAQKKNQDNPGLH